MSLQKMTTRHKPYNASQNRTVTSSRPKLPDYLGRMFSQDYTPPPKPAHFKRPFCNAVRLRTVAQSIIAKTYPHYTPKDEFELMILSGWTGQGIKKTEEDISAYIALHRAAYTQIAAGLGVSVVEYARRNLNEWAEVTGVSQICCISTSPTPLS